MRLTYFPSLRNAQGSRHAASWPGLVARLSVARVTARKEDAPGVSFATYRGDRRALANVETVHAIGLDLDHLDAVSVLADRNDGIPDVQGYDWGDVVDRYMNRASFAHTTWSSTTAALRVRVFLPLSRPVTGDEYRRVYAHVARQEERAGLVVDRAASDPSRFWFLPSVPRGGRFLSAVGQGQPVDVERALLAVPAPAPPPVPSRPSAPPGSGGPDLEERASRYIDRCEPAISGSGGHTATFNVAQRLVRGFALNPGVAYRLLARWNLTCQPPWPEAALLRKLRQAAERGTMPLGSLRDARRRAA